MNEVAKTIVNPKRNNRCDNLNATTTDQNPTNCYSIKPLSAKRTIAKILYEQKPPKTQWVFQQYLPVLCYFVYRSSRQFPAKFNLSAPVWQVWVDPNVSLRRVEKIKKKSANFTWNQHVEFWLDIFYCVI